MAGQASSTVLTGKTMKNVKNRFSTVIWFTAGTCMKDRYLDELLVYEIDSRFIIGYNGRKHQRILDENSKSRGL
jgi:hypothetical protein